MIVTVSGQYNNSTRTCTRYMQQFRNSVSSTFEAVFSVLEIILFFFRLSFNLNQHVFGSLQLQLCCFYRYQTNC